MKLSNLRAALIYMSSPRFTFCIPNLNKIQYLPVCIESMLAQDCEDWKCIFVDGYSTDGSWEYMQKFASDPRFLIRRGIKQGMYADWNECLKHVDTEYFYFLTSDDTCFPALVSTTVNALDSYLNVDVCHFQYCLISETGKTLSLYEEITEHQFDLYRDANRYSHLRSGICEFILHFAYRAIYTTITSLVFRRRLIETLHSFSTNYGSSGDFDWTMRMGLFTDVLYIPELLATWRFYQEQATNQTTRLKKQTAALDLATNNLNYFLQTERSHALKPSIQPQHLLADFLDEHASSLYEQAFTSKTNSDRLNYATSAYSTYPLYPVKKIINRLSGNKLYAYPRRLDLAEKFIETYRLQWPPLQISTGSHA